MSPTRFLPLFSAAILAASTVLAANWPQFRGPDHQGVSNERGLPVAWNSTSNVLWKVSIPGESWSSPIVWKDRVFLTTATENGESCRVLALNAKDGRILWDKEVFKQTPRRKEGRNSYATPTPATDGKRVYACFGDGSFAALDFSGKIVWTNRDFPFYSQHGLGTSPILHDGILVMARDGSSDGEDKKVGWQKPWDKSFVLALDAATGKLRWKTGRGLSRISHGVPTLFTDRGQTQVVSEAGDVVQGFDLKTGELLWTSEVLGEGKVPSTIVGDGLAFTSGGWGGKETIKAFRIGARGNLKESNLVWEQRKGLPKVPSMLFLKPYLYAITDGGIASCFAADTGTIVWQERVGGNFSASPIAAEGRLYFLSDEGVTTVLRAGPKFEVLATNPIGEKLQASMAAANGRILIRTTSHLWCIGSK